MILYEPLYECVEFYSECNFSGDTFEMCEDTSSFKAVLN